MICEGRILEKFEVRNIFVDDRMQEILDAMNYHRIVTIGKRDYDINCLKKTVNMIFLMKKIPHH